MAILIAAWMAFGSTALTHRVKIRCGSGVRFAMVVLFGYKPE
jgi:hypothetical protein